MIACDVLPVAMFCVCHRRCNIKGQEAIETIGDSSKTERITSLSLQNIKSVSMD